MSRDNVDRGEELGPITILIPCKDQKPAFFWDALQSIVHQTSPDWRTIVLFKETAPEVLRDQIRSLRDDRFRFVTQPNGNIATRLNLGLRDAATTFVSILLSDDRLTPDAIATMQAYRRRYPSADFFHSAKRAMSSDGQMASDIIPNREEVTLEHFASQGSPVKHMMCWRRRLSLDIGGMDEDLSLHGCDDFDFPWRMAEAGCRFQAVRECLYEYRRHTEFERLTTSVPLDLQIDTLRRMFAKHRVPEAAFCTFLEWATGSYLIRDHDVLPPSQPVRWAAYVEAGPERTPDFLDQSFRRRPLFPHRVYRLPKAGPDGFRLANAMIGPTDPGALREILVYGLPPATDEFPEALFFDDELAWHRQQFGRPAQIAAANIAVGRDCLHCYLLNSDIVQRISRRREFKTRIESVFNGWVRVLLNAVLDYAIDLGVKTIYSARAAHAMSNTDHRRIPPARYERIYDAAIQGLYAVEAQDDWWRLDVAANKHRCVRLDKKIEPLSPRKTICLFHDVERGLGHRIEDPDFSARIERPAQAALGRILQAEARAGIHTTYNVVGELWRELTPAILEKGHACAFHSFDHRLPAVDEIVSPTQLDRCRLLDGRVKGYRAPQSKITAELADAHLAHHNFEWLASSLRSLGREQPFMENGIVKIPVHLDDFDLYRHRLSFEEWESRAFDLIENQEVTALGLHDCYFEHWLPHYERLLGKLVEKGRIVTFDQLAAEVTFAHARWK